MIIRRVHISGTRKGISQCLYIVIYIWEFRRKDTERFRRATTDDYGNLNRGGRRLRFTLQILQLTVKDVNWKKKKKSFD